MTQEQEWETRDAAVLRAMVRLWEQVSPNGSVSPEDLAAATGLHIDTVMASLDALTNVSVPFFHVAYQGCGPYNIHFKSVTERARRLTGSWPMSEDIADRIVAALDAVTPRSDAEGAALTALRAGFRAAGELGKSLLVEVISRQILGQ